MAFTFLQSKALKNHDKTVPALHKLQGDIIQQANRLGFPLVGIVDAARSPGFARLCKWLDNGYAGSMDYMANRRSAYQHPNNVLEKAQSLVMLGMPYQPAVSLHPKSKGTAPTASSTSLLVNGQFEERLEDELPVYGRIAAYSTGSADYHDLIHDRLKQFKAWFQTRLPEAVTRGVVDTAPLLEREFAMLAGLGWLGKNTLLINRSIGSYFFLAALLVDQAIAPTSYAFSFDTHSSQEDNREDENPSTAIELPVYLTLSDVTHDYCGSCTACLDACPTQAFPEPRTLDANRCISYLTIEYEGIIARDLRGLMDDWIFGCDVCQQVCPWNRKPIPTEESKLTPVYSDNSIAVLDLLSLTESEFRERYRKTPFWRTRLTGMQRNAMIALGNSLRNSKALFVQNVDDVEASILHHQRVSIAIDAVQRFLKSDNQTLVVTAIWVLGECQSAESREILECLKATEKDSTVLEEIEYSLRN